MDPTMDDARLMAVYGIDEKALAALQKLNPEMQSVCLEKLQEGRLSGKVRNASAFLIGVVTGPDTLGIDEKARELLNELPKVMQQDLMNRLRTATDIQNPSAWIISAAIKAKKEGKTQGMGGMMGMMGMMGGQNLAAQMMFAKMKMGGTMARASPYGSPTGSTDVMDVIDEKAKAMLQQLPQEKQTDLVSCLQTKIQSGTCMNPSGWMVKSCIGAGAKTEHINAVKATLLGPAAARQASPRGASAPRRAAPAPR